MFSDGRARYSGRGAEPDAPEHMVPRAIDYSSSCSLLVRARTWDRSGAPTSRCSPAATWTPTCGMAAWAAGWTVRYEPSAVARHRHLGTMTAGFKAFAHGRNRDRFLAQVGGELELHEPWAPGRGGRHGTRRRARGSSRRRPFPPVAPGRAGRTRQRRIPTSGLAWPRSSCACCREYVARLGPRARAAAPRVCARAGGTAEGPGGARGDQAGWPPAPLAPLAPTLEQLIFAHLARYPGRHAHHDSRGGTSRVTTAPAPTNASSPTSTPGVSRTPPPTRHARRSTGPASRWPGGAPWCRRSMVTTAGAHEHVVLDRGSTPREPDVGLKAHPRPDRSGRADRGARPTTVASPIAAPSRTCARSPTMARLPISRPEDHRTGADDAPAPQPAAGVAVPRARVRRREPAFAEHRAVLDPCSVLDDGALVDHDVHADRTPSPRLTSAPSQRFGAASDRVSASSGMWR